MAQHYENFPVASLLMPRRFRPAVRVLYAFARQADDLADEGDAAPGARLSALNAFEEQLNRIRDGGAVESGLFTDLQGIIQTYGLPLEPLYDLLSAFRQDVVKNRYASHAEIMDYCRRSANPVGRLLLVLYGADTASNRNQADAICSALQRINFLQDVAVDWQKGRVYLPQTQLKAYGVCETDLAKAATGPSWRALMQDEVNRCRHLMASGAPLGLTLQGRLGLEMRAIVLGGLRILDRIEAVEGNIFACRPTLGKGDWLWIIWTAASARRFNRYLRKLS